MRGIFQSFAIKIYVYWVINSLSPVCSYGIRKKLMVWIRIIRLEVDLKTQKSINNIWKLFAYLLSIIYKLFIWWIIVFFTIIIIIKFFVILNMRIGIFWILNNMKQVHLLRVQSIQISKADKTFFRFQSKFTIDALSSTQFLNVTLLLVDSLVQDPRSCLTTSHAQFSTIWILFQDNLCYIMSIEQTVNNFLKQTVFPLLFHRQSEY